MKLNSIKLFLLAFILNLIENLGLLYFTGQDILNKETFLSATIFALAVVGLYKWVSWEKNEKE